MIQTLAGSSQPIPLFSNLRIRRVLIIIAMSATIPYPLSTRAASFLRSCLRLFKGLARAAFSIIPRKLRLFAAITFAAVTGHFEVLSAVQIGAVAGLIASGGDLKAGIIGAVTGGIAGGNGSALFKVAASAVVGYSNKH